MTVTDFLSLWQNSSISLRCSLCANVAFWLASLLNLAVDWIALRQSYDASKKPAASSKFAGESSSSSSSLSFLPRVSKLQPRKFISTSDLWEAFQLSAFNMAVVVPFICCPLFEYFWQTLHQHNRLEETDPWVWHVELMKVPIDMFLNEVTFYSVHYALHASTFLYQHIHKVHHRFHAPTAMAAAYAHPLEFIFGNVLVIAIGPILTNAHPFTSYVWFTLAILSTCKGHSGYDWLNASTHDDHHRYLSGNYGVLHFGDWIMGTRI